MWRWWRVRGRSCARWRAAARELGVEAVNCLCDVGNEGQILAAIAQAKTHLGHIDVLVNNAGTNVPSRSIHDTSAEEWRMLLEVNLTSAFLFTKALLPDMMARETGTIVNVASRAATHPSLLSGVGYATSKIGMQSLTDDHQRGGQSGQRACLRHQPRRGQHGHPRPACRAAECRIAPHHVAAG